MPLPDGDPKELALFEQLLKTHTVKKPSALYTNIKLDSNIRPQDVLNSVRAQIKTLNLADARAATHKQITVQKSTFFSVDRLPEYTKVSNKKEFETQCIYNTQLISITDDLVALHEGMTQEFGNTFHQTDNRNIEETDENVIDTQEFNTTFTQTNVDATLPLTGNEIDNLAIDNAEIIDIEPDGQDKSIFNLKLMKEKCPSNEKKYDCRVEFAPVDNNNTNHEETTIKAIENTNRNTHSLTSTRNYQFKDSIYVPESRSSSPDFNAKIDELEVKLNADLNFPTKSLRESDSQIRKSMYVPESRSPSPIFRIKPKTPKTSPENLVVPLNDFEKFENIALSLVDINKDFDVVKHLVNSQICEGELYLGAMNTYNDDIFYSDDDGDDEMDYVCCSPIIDKSSKIIFDNVKNRENRDNLKTVVTNLDSIKDSRDKKSDSLKDEILFSSDEENYLIHKEFKDFPLTTALETSFYNHSDVLDIPMLVGFQSSINKPIQIVTDSFNKAKNILDSDKPSDFSMNDLVEYFDEKSFVKNDLSTRENHKMSIDSNTDNEVKENTERDEKESGKSKPIYDNIDQVKIVPEIPTFVGFTTANKQNIKITDKALELGKKLLNDIKFDENDLLAQGKHNVVKKESKIPNNYTKLNNNFDDKIDDLLLEEFENIEMSLEDIERDVVILENNKNKTDSSSKTKNNDENIIADTKFVGFRTANNENINISAAALLKSKSVFQDIDNNIEEDITDCNPASTSLASIGGFKTTTDKVIKISDAALKTSGNVFSNLDNIEFPAKSKTETNTTGFGRIMLNKSPRNTIQSRAFEHRKNNENFKDISSCKSLKNNVMVLPKKSSARMKKLFGNLAMEDKNELSNNLSNNEIHLFKGFQTASKKPVIISDASLQNSKKIFEEIDSYNKTNPFKENICRKTVFRGNIETTNTKQNEPVNKSSKKATDNSKNLYNEIKLPIIENSKFVGFHTTNNTKAEISKQAFERSKSLFNDIEFCNIQDPTSFVGFQTASYKKVAISKEAIEKSKKVFNDLDISQKEHIESARSIGFQAANLKKVVVPTKAKEKSSIMCKDFDIPEIESSSTTSLLGFQTANNKKVEVSKEAIEKSKNIFNDLDVLDNNSLITTSFKGFQTASNKKVEISKEAIDKTKNIFRDIESCESEDKSSFVGFKTANNQHVDISKEALKMSKAAFNDIDSNDDDNESFMGFQTGNDKMVTVSENSLANSMRLHNKMLNNHMKVEDKLNNIYETIDAKESNKKTIKNPNTDVSLNRFKSTRKISEVNDTKKTMESGDHLIDTQVSHNFEKCMNAEDLKETPKGIKRAGSPVLGYNATPKRDKRSGSPILSCPRAKRRKKFEAPYKEKDKTPIETKTVPSQSQIIKSKVYFTKSYKKSKVISLKDLSNMTDSSKAIDPYITQFNIENILNFEFDSTRNDITDKKLTLTELKDIFLTAVSKNLVPEGWLDNHLKLILWKLLSYERKFNYKCTVKSVLDQLKFRYDKELYNMERSAFRKILERDDVSTKTMVLCVAGIYKDGVLISSSTVSDTDNIELLLTDGWYLMTGSVDRMLCAKVARARVRVGGKLATSGAELANCEGLAPWEDTSAVRLKLSGNSTRPAPWHAKLGYTRAAILSELSTVKVTGGKVARLRVFVTRVYPLLYVEKFEDGSSVTRSERLEHLQQMKYEAERELMMERIYEEVQKEFDQESQDADAQDSDNRRLESGSQIARLMKRSIDPMEFRAQLTPSQLHLLQEYSVASRERMCSAVAQRMSERMSARRVVPLARARVADASGCRGMLSVWQPNEAVLELVREGASVELMNCLPTAERNSQIQISAGRQTMFKASKCEQIPPTIQTQLRKFYSIGEISENPSRNTDYNEIDTAGIVFLIEPSHAEFKSNNFQNVYLADIDKNIISINFWGGVKKFGYENILDTGQVVACANLLKRAGNTRKNIPQFRVTEFTTFTKTPQNKQAKDVTEEFNKKLLNKRKFCDDCEEIKNNYSAIRCLNNENESPYRMNGSDYSFSRNNMFIETPVVKRKEDANLNLSGLDFESTFKQDTQLSPNTLLRKRKVNEKIAKLKMYGEPPPLSPINIIDKSANAKKSFKSPLIENTTNVTSVNSLPESPKCPSPILCTKRGYGKKVPVKLNFERNESVDHFADDFDASPPLSLD